MEDITLITPTGDRPLAFSMCQRWMLNQTVEPKQWIVIDDGKVPMKPYVPMEYIRREPQPSDPKCTLGLNLLKALSLVKYDKVLIFEDDEYYAPTYIAEMVSRLDKHELVGIGDTKYYHLFAGKYYRHGNTNRASLAQTAFHVSYLPKVKQVVKNHLAVPLIDSVIWRTSWNIACWSIFVDSNSNPLYVGIKGLPGRPGIIGHDPQARKYGGPDTNQSVLKKWIPKQEDYNIYMDIISKKENVNG